MPQAGSWWANKKHDGELAEMSDVNRIMFDAAVIRANESGEYTTNEEWAIQYAAGEIETLTTQLAEALDENEALVKADIKMVPTEVAKVMAENERLRECLNQSTGNSVEWDERRHELLEGKEDGK